MGCTALTSDPEHWRGLEGFNAACAKDAMVSPDLMSRNEDATVQGLGHPSTTT